MFLQETDLNVVPGGIIPVMHVSQYDVGRELKFVLYDGYDAADIATGTTATIEGTKPDGHGFQYSGTLDQNAHTATFVTTEQMTVLAGAIECKLTLYLNSQRIGTALFILDVEKAGINDSTIISDTELPLIIAQATEQMERAEAAADAAALSETNAATSETNAAASEVSAANSEIICGSFMRMAGVSAASAEQSAIISGSFMRTAGNYADDAEASAASANVDALKSEGHALGTQNGTPVSSDSPYYHNNAKYWADEARQSSAGGVAASVIATAEPTNISTHAYAIGDQFVYNGILYTATSAISVGATITPGTNCSISDTITEQIGNAGHTILDEDGITYPQRSKLQFEGCEVTDDSTNDITKIKAEGGVTGVKGNAESTYRRGNVNLTPSDLGALALDGDSKDNTVSFTSYDTATTEKTDDGMTKVYPEPSGAVVGTLTIYGTVANISKIRIDNTEYTSYDDMPVKAGSIVTFFHDSTREWAYKPTTGDTVMLGAGEACYFTVPNDATGEAVLTVYNTFNPPPDPHSWDQLWFDDNHTTGWVKTNIIPVLGETQPTEIPTLTTGEQHKSLFSKISAMFSNIRKLWNTVGETELESGKTITGLLGKTDISNVGSTVTGAIVNLNAKSKVLWTNSSPTSSFAAQTVNLTNSGAGYSYYLIVCISSVSGGCGSTVIVKGKAGFLSSSIIASSTNGGVYTYYRSITSSSDTQVVFGNGAYTTSLGKDHGNINTALIPYAIIGINC